MSRLVFWRKERRLSRQALSDRSLVPVSTITALENDFREATLSTWNALAKALKIPAKELYMKQAGNGLVPRERSRFEICEC